jgi:hypothetical protein
MAKSKLYVILPDGKKDFIDEEIVLKYGLKEDMKTVMGYEIKEDK